MFASLSFLACLFASTVSDIATFTDRDYRQNRPLVLSGRVMAQHEDTIAFEDDTGSALIRALPGKETPSVGDIVTMNCFGVLIEDFLCTIFARDFTVTGHFTPPAPRDVTVTDVAAGRCDSQRIRLRARVINALDDAIEPTTIFLHLTDGTNTAVVAYWRKMADAPLIGAEVEVNGLVMPNIGQWRRFQGRGIVDFGVPREQFVKVLAPPPADPFDVPAYSDLANVMPQDLVPLGRRAVTGRVRAVWHGDSFLIETKFLRKRYMQATLVRGTPPPAVGQAVKVIGLPRTDLFSIRLEQALWKGIPDGEAVATAPEVPLTADAHALLTGDAGKSQVQTHYHGRLVRMRGTVLNLPARDLAERPALLAADGEAFPVDASSCPEAFRDVEVGCKVEVTGIALLQADPWLPDTPVPDVRGFTLVVRSHADVRVLARPPWWTPFRMLVASGALFVLMAVVIVWNRRRERLKTEIARAENALRVDERTRLAVELHDSLAQSLTGISLQLNASQSVRADDAASADACLENALRMLKSCRADLRRCIWDLRNDALDEEDFEVAVRTTLQPVAEGAALHVCFRVTRDRISDATAHATLRILRELTVNAVQHGHARNIRIAGEISTGVLKFSVTDDGCGFDVANAGGPLTGHFGLTGIRERIKYSGGRLEISSRAGHGTRACVEISRPKNADGGKE